MRFRAFGAKARGFGFRSKISRICLFRPRFYTLYLPRTWAASRRAHVPYQKADSQPPHNISNRSQNARSMAHSLLTHSVSLSVVQFVVVGRSRQIKLSGRSALTVACNRPFSAHTSGFRAFDSAQNFRDVNIISRICSENRRISLTTHPWPLRELYSSFPV